jgi:hypothetical protein
MNDPRPTKKQARILFYNPDIGSTEVVEHRGINSKILRDAIKAAEERFWEVYEDGKSRALAEIEAIK